MTYEEIINNDQYKVLDDLNVKISKAKIEIHNLHLGVVKMLEKQKITEESILLSMISDPTIVVKIKILFFILKKEKLLNDLKRRVKLQEQLDENELYNERSEQIEKDLSQIDAKSIQIECLENEIKNLRAFIIIKK